MLFRYQLMSKTDIILSARLPVTVSDWAFPVAAAKLRNKIPSDVTAFVSLTLFVVSWNSFFFVHPIRICTARRFVIIVFTLTLTLRELLSISLERRTLPLNKLLMTAVATTHQRMWQRDIGWTDFYCNRQYVVQRLRESKMDGPYVPYVMFK